LTVLQILVALALLGLCWVALGCTVLAWVDDYEQALWRRIDAAPLHWALVLVVLWPWTVWRWRGGR
jgi:hypothetical protein